MAPATPQSTPSGSVAASVSEVTWEDAAAIQSLSSLQSCCFQVKAELLALFEWSEHLRRHFLLALFLEEEQLYFLGL